MANSKNTKPAPAAGNNFQPTFRKYQDMSETEKAAFRQGAKTSENKVKERLGFIRPSDAKKTKSLYRRQQGRVTKRPLQKVYAS